MKTYVVNLRVQAKTVVHADDRDTAVRVAKLLLEAGDVALSEPEVLDVLEAEIA